jgi:ribonuclease T1
MIRLGIGCTMALLIFLGSHAPIGSSAPRPSALANSSLMELAFQPVIPTVLVGQLPPEVRQTMNLIQRGGPYPYRKDGTLFGNREKRLPLASPGYYREYTVPTPDASDRGARRIVTGQQQEYYYIQDHYRSFSRVKF